MEREDTLAAETKSPMQTFAVSDISSLSFLFLFADHTMYKILNNTVFLKGKLSTARLRVALFFWFQKTMCILETM